MIRMPIIWLILRRERERESWGGERGGEGRERIDGMECEWILWFVCWLLTAAWGWCSWRLWCCWCWRPATFWWECWATKCRVASWPRWAPGAKSRNRSSSTTSSIAASRWRRSTPTASSRMIKSLSPTLSGLFQQKSIHIHLSDSLFT